MESNNTSVRILDLLFELTYAERGRSRSQIRRLTHYRKLSDTAFDSAFTHVAMSSFTAYAGQLLSCLSFHSKNFRCST